MRRAFTLLEVVVSLAILGLALLAIFDLNSGAVASHAYAKRLTVATMLARSKMTDIEQELYDKGFDTDDREISGDFRTEGWEAYTWKAQILAPRTTEKESGSSSHHARTARVSSGPPCCRVIAAIASASSGRAGSTSWWGMSAGKKASRTEGCSTR